MGEFPKDFLQSSDPIDGGNFVSYLERSIAPFDFDTVSTKQFMSRDDYAESGFATFTSVEEAGDLQEGDVIVSEQGRLGVFANDQIYTASIGPQTAAFDISFIARPKPSDSSSS